MRTFHALGLAAALSATPMASSAPPDTLEQRIAACLSCHSVKERGDAYFPRIAGKPAGYLYNQLRNFRDGHRQYPMMNYMVAHLPDAYLREIADYFAAQHPPYATAAAGSGASASAVQLARGEALVRHGDAGKKIPACVACHGAGLTDVEPAIPGLLGLPSDYINAQFGNWKGKTRRAAAPDCMADIAARLSVEDVAALSAWLSRQPPDADARPATSLPAPLPIACGSVPSSATRAPAATAAHQAAPGAGSAPQQPPALRPGTASAGGAK
ncbi:MULTISPECIES: c-type cytochrome [unclassified Duganella]|uniref:c-type cytochrome n=1 Tax=unclassified Duganella TaxID=2636909 RepID=UPI00088F870C|nr:MULTISPECIES: c-type cytochrome [unclassified Duganella]SDH53309.1 Cytochrome c553 [Duganella sp. OV458]SDK69483.1 Cytochrome c553 [Duganella sp. OV510]